VKYITEEIAIVTLIGVAGGLIEWMTDDCHSVRAVGVSLSASLFVCYLFAIYCTEKQYSPEIIAVGGGIIGYGSRTVLLLLSKWIRIKVADKLDLEPTYTSEDRIRPLERRNDND